MICRRADAAGMAKNATYKVAVQGTRLMSLAFVVLAARVLGPEGFGRFTFAYAAATILGAALDLGVPVVLVRRVAQAPAGAAAEWATAATLKLAVLVPVGCVYALFPVLAHRTPETVLAVWLLGIAIGLQSFIELAVAAFTGLQVVGYELGVRVIEKLVLVGVGLAGLAVGGGLVAVTGAFAAAAAVSLGVSVLVLHRRCARFTGRWHPGRARGLARHVGPVAIWFLLGFATSRLVPLLVAFRAGDLAAGYLGAAIRVLDVVLVLPVAVTAAVYPVLAQTAPTDPRFRQVAVGTVELMLLVTLPIGLALALGGHWLAVSVYGPGYAPTGRLLAVLSVSIVLDVIVFVLSAILLALDRPGRLLVLGGAGFAASAILTSALVGPLGALGGAIALCGISLVTAGGSLIALRPFIGLPFGSGALKALGAAAVAALAAGLLPAAAGWRTILALGLYAGTVLALRPVPPERWRLLVRGALGTVVPALDRGQP